MKVTVLDGPYNYTSKELEEICDAVLNDKELRFKELEPIREYLAIYQKNYFNSNYNYLNNLINILITYKEELKKLDLDFITKMLKIDIMKLCTPTYYAVEELLILLDKNRKEFDYSYYHSIGVIIETIMHYDKILDHDLSKYVTEAVNTYYIYINYPAYKESNGLLQYDLYRFSEYIVAYAYYNSLEPIIIGEFLIGFINNYEEIIAKCEVNNMNRRQEIDMDYANYIVNYVLSLNGNRKVIS